MFDLDNAVDFFIENMKKVFFPEEWIKMDLKFSKFEIFTMLFVDKRKEITMTELVEYINTPMSTATGIVDRLVKNEYIKRERSETDRRIVVLRLTDTGSQLVNNFKNVITKYISSILDDLTEEEKQFLYRIIFKIMSKLQTELNVNAADGKDEFTIKKINIE